MDIANDGGVWGGGGDLCGGHRKVLSKCKNGEKLITSPKHITKL